MNVGIPQAIVITLLLISLGIAMTRLGELKRPDRYDGVDLAAPFIMLWLLWWGGFFNE